MIRAKKKTRFWLGKKRPDISAKQLGEKSHQWKGEKVGYRALHRWIEKRLGKPRHCAFCQSTDREPREYHWANISKSYLRDLSDWIRLCATCHGKFDCGKLSI